MRKVFRKIVKAVFGKGGGKAFIYYGSGFGISITTDVGANATITSFDPSVVNLGSEVELADFNGIAGITTDGTNIFIFELSGYTIRKMIISSSVISTIADTVGLQGTTDATGSVARFHSPRGIVYDRTRFFIGENTNHAICKIQ